jgi:hypothetical protein
MPPEVITELWLKAIGLVFSILGAVVVFYLRPVLVARFGEQRLQIISDLAQQAYSFVEVQAKRFGWDSDEKLQEALDYLDARLAELRIPVTAEQLRAAIEEVWLMYNHGKLSEDE